MTQTAEFDIFRLREYKVGVKFYYEPKTAVYFIKIYHKWFFKWVLRKVLSFPATERGWLEAAYTYQVKRNKFTALENIASQKGRYGFTERFHGRVYRFLKDGCWLSTEPRRKD